MSRLSLSLVGEPKLFVDGKLERVGTRTVFEVLAHVLVAPGGSISRKDVCEAVWPHLEPTARSAQLRITLTKLRSELDRLGIRDQFDLDSKRLSVLEQATSDLDMLRTEEFSCASDLIPFCRPVAPGWTSERWRQYEEILSNSLAEAYLHFRQTSSASTCSNDLPFLRAATEQYRTSVVFHVELLRCLDALGAKSEALEHVIAFEDAWVERFGNGDIPDLWKQASSGTPSPPTPPEPIREVVEPIRLDGKESERRVGRGWLLLALVIFTLMILTGSQAFREWSKGERIEGFDQWNGTYPEIRNERDLEPGRLWVRRSDPIEIGGESARTWEILTHHSSIRAFQRTTDGGFVFEVNGYRSEWVKKVAWNTKGAQSSLKGDGAVVDIIGSRRLIQIQDGLLVVQSDGGETRYVGDKEFPRFIGEQFLPDGRVLATRMCGHVFGCHRYLVIADQGRFKPLCPISDAQVVAYSFMRGSLIYGKFSRGKSAGWRYTPFVYDSISGAFRSLEGAPLIGISDSGFEVRRPEKTDIINGDYQTKENGEVVFVDPSGVEKKLEIEGFDRFRSAYLVGNLLVVDIKRKEESDLDIVDMNGFTNPEIRPRLAHSLLALGSPNARAVLIAFRNQTSTWSRYLLIESDLFGTHVETEPPKGGQFLQKQSHMTHLRRTTRRRRRPITS